MKKILFVLFLFCGYLSYGQIGIITADTVCANTTITLNSDDSSFSYAWDTTSVNIGQSLQVALPQLVGPNYLNSVCYTVKYDPVSNNWFGFSVNSNSFTRVNYGTSPLSLTPTATTFGNLSGYINSGNAEYVDIVRDTTGLWYAFITDGGHLVRLDFGNSLSNTPNATTDAHTVSLSGVSRTMQISFIRYNGKWMAFIGNDGGGFGPNNVTRLDFGTNITTLSPTVTQLPNGGSPAAFTNPSYFALYNDKIAGTWSMLVTDRGNGGNGSGLSRYDFGTNLQNNSPTATNLGNFGGTFQFPRGITIIESCDSFYALATANGIGGSNFIHLSFNNGTSTNITNAPLINDLGQLATQNNTTKTSLNTFWNNDSLYVVTPCSGNQTIYLLDDYGLSAGGKVTYSPQVNFNLAPGYHTIQLFCDQGNEAHRGHYCKTIYAVAPGVPLLGPDTTACKGDSLTLTPLVVGNGIPSYTWSTGATTSSIVVKAGGAYSVTVTGAGLCTTGTSNTQLVQFVDRPVVNLGPDTTICSGNPVTLKSDSTYPASFIYSWNTTPTQTTSSITVNTSGTYTLIVNDAGCSGTASINVTANPSPVVNLGNDTTFCGGYTDNLLSSQPAGSTFLWNNGSTDSTIAIVNPGKYWLQVTLNNCTSADSINISVSPAPVFSLGNDTVICDNIPLTIGTSLSNISSYSWSTDSTLVIYKSSYSITDSMRALTDSDNYITIRTGGIFSLTVVATGGCSYSDTISIIAQPGPHIMFNIPRDTTLCKNQPFVIDPGFASGLSYAWNTGATTKNLTVNESGSYWVTVATSNGCRATDTVSIKMISIPASGILGNDTTLCNDQQLMIPPFIDTSLHIKWYENQRDASHYTDNALFHKVRNAPGLYIAEITNECGTTVDSIMITNKFCSLWFPNVFTPNNDGVNDMIQPLGDLSLLSNYTLTVYDRWGNLLFTSTNPYFGWNGKYNNTDQPVGVYIYNMQFNVDNVPYTQHGNFTLLK